MLRSEARVGDATLRNLVENHDMTTRAPKGTSGFVLPTLASYGICVG